MQFTDTETKIFNLLEKTVDLIGFDLVSANLVNDGIKTLRIIIDGKNGVKLSIDDCKNVSKKIAPMLDVEDLISGKYLLEVSSAGVERPLVRKGDYVRFIGSVILVKLLKPLDNQKKIKGTLRGVDDDTIVIEVSKDREMETKTIPLEIIKGAHLVFTEDMFRAILKS